MEMFIVGTILFIGGGILTILALLWFFSWLLFGAEGNQSEEVGSREIRFVSMSDEFSHPAQQRFSLLHIIVGLLLVWISSDG